MIIVEGMDNTGKSTLIKNLQQKLPIHTKREWEVLCTSSERDHLKQFVTVSRHINYPSKFAFKIHDRIHVISEQIYGSVIRNNNRWSVPYGVRLFTRWRESSPTIIWCRPPEKKILNFGDRDQMSGVIQHAQDLIFAYDAFMEDLSYSIDFNGHIINYDWTVDSVEDLITEILDVYRSKYEF